jgi:hypothetical protein
MATIAEVENLALDLPEPRELSWRHTHWESLPSVLYEEGEGIAEALRAGAKIKGLTMFTSKMRAFSATRAARLDIIRR